MFRFNMRHTAKLFLATLLLAGPLAYGGESDRQRWRLVNYWSEWCAPCRVEIPMFNALQARLIQHDIEIVGVNFDEDPHPTTLRIAAELGIEFPVLEQATVKFLGLRPPDVLPTTYLLSPSGEVAAKLIGMQDEQAIVDALATLGILDQPQLATEPQ